MHTRWIFIFLRGIELYSRFFSRFQIPEWNEIHIIAWIPFPKIRYYPYRISTTFPQSIKFSKRFERSARGKKTLHIGRTRNLSGNKMNVSTIFRWMEGVPSALSRATYVPFHGNSIAGEVSGTMGPLVDYASRHYPGVFYRPAEFRSLTGNLQGIVFPVKFKLGKYFTTARQFHGGVVTSWWTSDPTISYPRTG